MIMSVRIGDEKEQRALLLQLENNRGLETQSGFKIGDRFECRGTMYTLLDHDADEAVNGGSTAVLVNSNWTLVRGVSFDSLRKVG